jgi:hypothetical protein
MAETRENPQRILVAETKRKAFIGEAQTYT